MTESRIERWLADVVRVNSPAVRQSTPSPTSMPAVGRPRHVLERTARAGHARASPEPESSADRIDRHFERALAFAGVRSPVLCRLDSDEADKASPSPVELSPSLIRALDIADGRSLP